MALRQKTINLPPSHPVRSMEGLAKQIALPHEHQPMRFPSFPALERTAVLGFSVPTTLTLPASTAVKVALMRQAAYPLWAEQSATDCISWYSYTMDYEVIGTTTSSGIIPVGPIWNAGVGNIGSTPGTAGVAGFGSFPGSPYPLLGMDAATGSRPWIFVPDGCFIKFVCGASGATYANSTTVAVTWEVWSSPGETYNAYSMTAVIAATQCTAGGYGAAVASSMYNRWVRPASISMAAGAAQAFPAYTTLTVLVSTSDWTFAGSGSNAGLCTLNGTGTQRPLMPITFPVEFANSVLPWYAARTTASAFLGTNVSQILVKGGTILGGRVSPNVMTPWMVTSGYVNSLHPAEKAFLPLETGVYTYCPPSTDMAHFYDYTVPRVSTGVMPNYPVYRLDNDSLYNVLYITAASTTESLAITADWHIEFRTSSALFDVGLCTMSLESLHTAQLALAAAGFFFENPTHGKILGKVVDAAKRFGPSLVSMVSPMAGSLMKQALLLSKSPAVTNHMKTTSGASSGINPHPVKKVVVKKKKATVAKSKKK